MKSKVYFIRSTATHKMGEKALEVFLNAKLDSLIKPGIAALKTHFGEPGNTSFIPFEFIQPTLQHLRSMGVKPYFAETSTLYRGRRSNAVDHFESACEHGFCYEKTGGPIIFVDGLKGNNHAEIEVGLKHFDTVAIAHDFIITPSAVIFTHITGHELAGLGGAIKNLAMGLASRAGKMRQHDSGKPVVNEDDCIACGTCKEWCPADAITINNSAQIDNDSCIGCGECLTLCPTHAVNFSWSEGAGAFSEKMAEYAFGAIKNKLNQTAFVSHLWKITFDCNCKGKEMETLCPDIGILASNDPVAIDQATADIIIDTAGKDVFNEKWPSTHYEAQLEHGAAIGLGSRDYELLEV